jgi:hypothetical protein
MEIQLLDMALCVSSLLSNYLFSSKGTCPKGIFSNTYSTLECCPLEEVDFAQCELFEIDLKTGRKA